jgi:sugar lactone lactonase YvrE
MTMTRTSRLFLLVFALAFGSCKKKSETASEPVAPPPAEPVAAQPDAGTSSPNGSLPTPTAVARIDGFSTPESILHDVARDRYLVSNINGNPTGKDDNGFISVVAPDGKVTNLKWIDGASPDFELNAPMGMAIVGNTLVVADITAVRKFDIETGKLLASIEIVGSTFLNDVAPGPADSVYVSDSGLTPEFKPSGSDAIIVIKADNIVEKLFADKSLGGPNGVWADGDDGVLVVTFGSGELYRVAKEGKHMVQKPLKGQLDGLLVLADGRLVFSSWEGKNVYIGPRTGPFTEFVTGVESPADIGWDNKRNRLLIPLFQGNAVAFYDLPENQP